MQEYAPDSLDALIWGRKECLDLLLPDTRQKRHPKSRYVITFFCLRRPFLPKERAFPNLKNYSKLTNVEYHSPHVR